MSRPLIPVSTIITGSLTALLMNSGVWAQDSTHKTAEGTQINVLEEVMVTTRRREESLSDTPVSVTALSPDALNERNIAAEYDLNAAVPGLNVTMGFLTPVYSIRGRGQTFGTSSGSVETYFAEVPLSAPYGTPALPLQFFDLSSIQVLKGPQGTLFGRNTTGGAILVTPAAPTRDFEGYLRVQGGEFDNRLFEGAVNIPLNDEVALRLAVFNWQRDGYAETLGGRTDAYGKVLPKQDYLNKDVTELRATLVVEPTDALAITTILTYHSDKNRISSEALAYRNFADPYSPTPITGSAAKANVIDTDVDLKRRASDNYAVINTTTYNLTPGLRLKNILSYMNIKAEAGSPADYDGNATAVSANGIRPPRQLENEQITNEFQLQGDALSDRLSYIVGAFYDEIRQPESPSSINPQIFGQVFPTGSPDFFVYQYTFQANLITSKALFASTTYKLTDQLNLTIGARHTWDEVSNVFAAYTSPNYDAQPTVPLTEISKKFKGWAYNAGLDYAWKDNTLVYGGYRRGYKRGGFNTNSPEPTFDLFDPETVNDYYIGVKQGLRIGGVAGQFNIEAFYDDYKDAQRSNTTLDGNAVINYSTNAEELSYKGFDAEWVLAATSWLTLSGSYSFIDAEYGKYTDVTAPTPTDMSINPVSNVVKNKSSLSARFHYDLADGSELVFASTYSYQSRNYTTDNAKQLTYSTALLFNGGQQVDLSRIPERYNDAYIPSYSTLDLRVEWNNIRGSEVDLAATLTNATDEEYRISGSYYYLYGSAAAAYGPPRMFTLEAHYRF